MKKILLILLSSFLCFSVLMGCQKKDEKKETEQIEETFKSEKKTYTEVVTVESFNEDDSFIGSYEKQYDRSIEEYLGCNGQKLYIIPKEYDIELHRGTVIQYTYSYMTHTDEPNITLENVELISQPSE